MTYYEMVEMVKEHIREGKPLHGYMMEIAIEIALDEKEG